MECNDKQLIIKDPENGFLPNSDKIFTNLEDEFTKLLTDIDSSSLDAKDDISNIDLEFLKNDYIELYDMRKLLNDPKYHIAKFKIQFFDFINLNDYFYKALDNVFISEQKNIKKVMNQKDNQNKKQSSNPNSGNENKLKESQKNSNEIEKIKKQNKKNKKYKDGQNESKQEDENNEHKNNTKKDSLEENGEEKAESAKEIENKNESNSNSKEDKSKKIENITQHKDDNSSINNISTNKEENNIGNKLSEESLNKDFKNIYPIGSYSSENIYDNPKTKKGSQSTIKYSNILESSLSASALEKVLTGIKPYDQEDKMHQFKFKYIKKELGLEEYEKMTGKAYEDFARKSFKIMLMIISQDDIKFENPNKVFIDEVIEYYLTNSKNKSSSLKIETDIHDIIGEKLVDTNMEIDIIAEFKYTIIEKLKNYFRKNIFFAEEIYKSGDEKQFDDITLIVEIARNIIIQGKEKLNQAIRYIELISILNLYNSKVTQNIDSSPILSFCEKYKISVCTTKMFCIITDGDYSFLKYVFNEIIKKIFTENYNDVNKIKEFIKKQLEDKDIMEKIEEEEMKLMEENIYNNYLMFDTLKKNNIKFCVLYIGDINHNLYQQNLVYNAINNRNLIQKNIIEELFKSFEVKKSLPEIKKKNRDLKIKISSFIKEINSITEKKFDVIKSNPNFDSLINSLLNGLKIDKFLKISRELKFYVTFNIFGWDKSDLMFLEKIKEFQENNPFKYLKGYEIKKFESHMTFFGDFTEKVKSSLSQNKFEIYTMLIDQNNTDDIVMLKQFNNYRSEKNCILSNNIRYLVYNKNNSNNIKLDLENSDFQYILDKKIININKRIINEIHNLKKTIKYSEIKIGVKSTLNKENLTKKLKAELHSLFNLNSDKNFEDVINKINNEDYSLNDEQYKNLSKYFEDAFKLVNSKIIMLEKFVNKKDDNALKKKLNELNENIICQRIYSYLYFKIIAYINDGIYSLVKNELSEFIKDMEITSVNK